MILTFGKYKGHELEETPQWYQKWINEQDWFKEKQIKSHEDKILKEMAGESKKLKSWNGISKKGQSSYDRIFELESNLDDLYYCDCGKRKNPEQKYCSSCE